MMSFADRFACVSLVFVVVPIIVPKKLLTFGVLERSSSHENKFTLARAREFLSQRDNALSRYHWIVTIHPNEDQRRTSELSAL